MAMGSNGSSPAGPSFLGVLGLVFVAIAGLFTIDTLLARVERREGRAEARRLLQQGELLAKQGRNAEAIDRFRSALSVSRGNPEVELALANALAAVGRLLDAETLLRELLQRQATDGATNLTMARVLVREGRAAEAVSFYHQAIYGTWKQDGAGNRVKVRFELIDLLVRQGAKREVLAELLPLQDEAPQDLPTRERIAHLYLVAGSPARALEIYEEILRQQSKDVDAHAGVGEAEFALGNYRTARAYFLSALRLDPADEEIRLRLGVCETVLALDPTQRGLSSRERYRRSLKLVALTLDAVDQCAATSPVQNTRDFMDKARQALKRRMSPGRQDQATEANLELAEQLWQARTKVCRKKPPASEEPLALVIARLAQ